MKNKIKEIENIFKSKEVEVSYNEFRDEIIVNVWGNTWKKLDNEKSALWKKFSDYIDTNDLDYEYNYHNIIIFEE